MSLIFNIPIYEAGTGGVPTTAFITDLGPQIDNYQHAIKATGGFESMSVTLTTTLDDAMDMLMNWLMRSTVVTDADGRVVWEGALVGVTARMGQETRSVSVDSMANRVRVRYSTVSYGTPGTSPTVSDATSIAKYGVKDCVVSVGTTTASAAANLAAAILSARKNPVPDPTTAIATGDMGTVQVTLNFAGWYDMLGWVVTSSTSTNLTGSGGQVLNLLTSYNTVNAFFSSEVREVAATSLVDTEAIPNDTPYRQKIEDLFRQGNIAGQRLAWGVYENRVFVEKPWAGAAPNTITYCRWLGESDVYNAYGAVVPPWLVRPDAMYQVQDLIDVSPPGSSPDGAARFYVERVTCAISEQGITVSLEPQASRSIDARIATLKG